MDISKIINALKGAKWYLIVLVFLGFTLYTLKDPIEKFLHLGTEKFFKNVPQRINRDVVVDELLLDLMYVNAADRAYIFRFHNGQNYYDGTHKLRMSCEYETVNNGIEPQAHNLRDLPTSLYPKFISEVIEGKMFYEDIETIEDLTTRVSLKKQGITSIACAPFFSENGDLVAIIGVDYVNRKPNRELILERQKSSTNEWSSSEQKRKFILAINSIGRAMTNEQL